VIVACSTLCFSHMPLDEALRRMRDLHFAKADLAIHAAGPHLTPAEVAADVSKIAVRLKAANMPIAAFHLDFGDAPDDVAREQFQAIARLARLMAVPVLTIGAAPRGTEPTAEYARLADLVGLATREGLILTLETRTGTMTEEPVAALELCRAVPGLGLALDPSHWLSAAAAKDDEAPFRYVKHVRLRDSSRKPNEFQVRVGQGEVEFGKIHGQLERSKYDRTLTVDVRDVPNSPFPVEPEVRKLKFLLESMA